LDISFCPLATLFKEMKCAVIEVNTIKRKGNAEVAVRIVPAAV